MITNSIAAAKEMGIKMIPNIIVGFPEETEKTYERTKKYLEEKSEDLFGVNFAMFTDYSSPDCVGEVDFIESDKIELHRRYWKELNNLARHSIIDKRKIEKQCNLVVGAA